MKKVNDKNLEEYISEFAASLVQAQPAVLELEHMAIAIAENSSDPPTENERQTLQTIEELKQLILQSSKRVDGTKRLAS